jgi:hypothetical protein
MPPNHLRADWSDVDAWFARMGQATGGAVHHGASLPQMMVYDPALLRGLEHGEIARGYNALAYHTMWADDADSAEARPYGAMGAATGGHNETTIAFCAPGYFHPPHNHIPSDVMVRAMGAEFYWLRTNIDPRTGLTYMTWDAPILPHAEWTRGTQWATACCGETFIERVAEIDALSRSPLSSPRRPSRMFDFIGKVTFPDGSIEHYGVSGDTPHLLAAPEVDLLAGDGIRVFGRDENWLRGMRDYHQVPVPIAGEILETGPLTVDIDYAKVAAAVTAGIRAAVKP